MHRAAPSRWSRPISRRHVIGAGASVLMPGSRPGAHAQGTPESLPERPHPNPSSERDSSSWFVTSWPAELDATGRADRFEVYDGRTFALLGGFQAISTGDICLTANPAKILLSTPTGPSIFDLDNGNVAQVTWDTEETVGSVRLPDPRWTTPTPPRWSFFTDLNINPRALLVDLDNATGVDLQEMLVKSGETATYPSIRFSPDGALAVASVSNNGFYLLDPESPADARLLDGGIDGMISWAPDFSPDGSRLAYVLVPASDGRGKPMLVVEDLESGDVSEIGPISPYGFAVFSPGSDDDLIILDGGTVTRREIDGGREVWRAESEAVVLEVGTYGNTLFLGSMAHGRGSTVTWQTIDSGSGGSHPLPLLDGLTSYNGSYVNPEPAFQLMGPSARNPDYRGRLAAVNLESAELIPLLDEIDGRALEYTYATSRDSGVILYTPLYDQRYYLFDLATGRQRTFAYDPVTKVPNYPAISPDGATVGFFQGNSSGLDRGEVWLLDVAGGGEPEPFIEGRLWLWAGGTPAPGAGTAALKPSSGEA